MLSSANTTDAASTGHPGPSVARWDLEKRALAQVPGSKVEVRIAAITRSARYAEKLSFLREG